MHETKPADLTQGISANSLRDGGTVLGRVGDEDVLLVRVAEQVFAVQPACPHYGGALKDGVVVGETIR